MAEIRKRGDSYQICAYLGRDAVTGKKQYARTTINPESTTPKAIEKEVNDFARDFEKRALNGELYSGDKTTFSDFVAVWENLWLKKNVTLSVQERYMKDINKLFIPAFGNVPISKIKAIHIDKILLKLEEEGKAPKTIRHAFTAINSVMKYAFKKEVIKENPCLRCDVPKVRNDLDKELHYFTVEQAKTFLNALTLEYTQERQPVTRKIKKGTTSQITSFTRLDPSGKEVEVSGSERTLVNTEYHVSGYTMKHRIPLQYQAYFNLAIFGGFRRGEICALTWNDIDFDKRSVSINKAFSKTEAKGQIVKCPKTQKANREIILPEECFRILREWRKEELRLCLKLGTAWSGYRGNDFDQNYVFIDLTSGKPMNLDTPGHKFHEIIEMYNKQFAHSEEDKLPQIRLHDLRHTSATLLLANNCDIETVSKRLGHAKPSITLDVYGHALEEMDEKASDTLEKIFAS